MCEGESVSKHVTNGSKTAVMDVIGSVCVSLGSSTVQLNSILSDLRCMYVCMYVYISL
jgi:hypothetical protein